MIKKNEGVLLNADSETSINNLMNNLYILNSSPQKTGAGRYAGQLLSVTLNPANFTSAIWDATKSPTEFQGLKLARNSILNFDPLVKFTSYGARLFPRLLFKEYFRFVKRVKSMGGIIHYASQLVFPLYTNDSDIVTILDIFALNMAKQRINRLILKKYLNFSNILTISNDVANQIKLVAPNSKPVVIYPYASSAFHKIDKKEARRITGINGTDKIILNISSQQQRKNLGFIEKVMKKLGSEYRLVRVGPRIGNEKNFENVSDEFLNAIYNAADLFLFPTNNEGFGYPIIEAMSCGLPVVASNIPVVREITKDAAVLKNLSSVDDFANCIKETINSPDEIIRKELDRAKYFRYHRFRNELLNYYKSVGGK